MNKTATKVITIISIIAIIGIIIISLINNNIFYIDNNKVTNQGTNQQINCREHKDNNKDRICDLCNKEMYDMDYVQATRLETTVNNKNITLIGNMPKNVKLKVEEIKEAEQEKYKQKATEFFKEDFIEIAYALDIKITNDNEIYQPEEYNQTIEVQLTNNNGDKNINTKNINDKNRDDQNHYAVLHIKEDESIEVLDSKIITDANTNKTSISFKTTSFSAFLVIQVAGKNISFTGDHVKLYDSEMNELTETTTVASNTNFEFIAIAEEGYGINPSTNSNITSSGSLGVKRVVIKSITVDMEVEISTTTAPVITVQPQSLKTPIHVTPTLEITAENATSYQWQVRRNHEGYWVNASGSGSTSRSFKPDKSITDVLGVYELRCLVGNNAFTSDNRIISKTVFVIVVNDFVVTYDVPIILDQNIVKSKVKIGEEQAVYDVTAQGKNLTFTWQYRTKVNNHWQNISNSVGTVKNTTISTANGESVIKSVLTTVVAQKSMQMAEFRCLVGNDSFKADVTLRTRDMLYLAVTDDNETKYAYHKIGITTQPTSKKVAIGDIATFTVETEAADTYKWQYKTSYLDERWTDVDATMGLDTTVATGYNTAELKINTTPMSVNVVSVSATSGDTVNEGTSSGDVVSNEAIIENNLSGYVFRCVVSSSAVPNATKESKTVLLSVVQDETLYQHVEMITEPTLEVPNNMLVVVDKTKDIEIDYNGDGELSVSSSDENIVTATTTKNILSVTGVSSGKAMLTLSASAGAAYESKETTINVEVTEEGKMLITEWTIPADADGVSGDVLTNESGDVLIDDSGNEILSGPATTIKLPIPANANNSYTVDWGDGSVIETFDSTADFPSHTYTNTEETVYTIKVTGTVNSFGYASHYSKPTETNDKRNYYLFTQYLTGLKQWGELGAKSYGFSYCSNLSSTIPEPTENSMKNLTTAYCLFSECSNLTGEIPANLFEGATEITSFQKTFNNCSSLTGSIPEELFVDTSKVTIFSYTFWNCSGLTGEIPSKLFLNTSEVTDFNSTFSKCNGLMGSIPKNLFVNNTKVTIFGGLFSYCSSLEGSIPGDLFKNTVNVKDFSSTFRACINITGSIPEELFESTSKVTTFANTFRECSGLTGTIPENLFVNTPLVTSFNQTFGSGCSNLTGSIPEKLFINNPLVTDFSCTFSGCGRLNGNIPENLFKNNQKVKSFEQIFRGCSSLTGSIPENLFANTPEVTTFHSTFWGCGGLTGNIPEKLFANNHKVMYFVRTFADCTGLVGSIPTNLFKNNIEVTDFGSTFSGCKGLTGIVPAELFINNKKVTSFNGTFYQCDNIVGAELQITTTEDMNLDNMFYGCDRLKTLVLGENVKHLKGGRMFNASFNIQSIIFLNNTQESSEVPIIANTTTLGLSNNTRIYVPTAESELAYEQAWAAQGYTADRIEQVIKAIEPNPDYVGLGEVYDDPGYTVAGFPSEGEESNNWKQYGFFIEIDGDPVDTSTVGSKWMKYRLRR